MSLALHDPVPFSNEYLSKMYFGPMRNYRPLLIYDSIPEYKDCTVLIDAHLLTPDAVSMLKNNNCRIVGFSVTDSSYVDQSCREANYLQNIDLMFMLTGIQKVNHGHEMIVTKDFEIALEPRQFLPEEDWHMFHSMHHSGRLQSLPYVHWEIQVDVPAQPYSQRSQKALIRGGHHMRRFILALKLMKIDRLDINSGFVTEPYFQDGMNPQFRYCDECRKVWKRNRVYPEQGTIHEGCTNPMAATMNLSDLGQWNNKCPQSFYEVADRMIGKLGTEKSIPIDKLLNAKWLSQRDHLEMLARITFTSDLKWLFSIYAAQRFWDAAMVGCVNLLPGRTADQDYFPAMYPGEHYLTFGENLNGLELESEIDKKLYGEVSANAKALYDSYMRPTDFSIGTPILKHIFDRIEEHAT